MKKVLLQRPQCEMHVKSSNAPYTVSHSAFSFPCHLEFTGLKASSDSLQHLIHACIKPLKLIWPECCERDLEGNLSHKDLSEINFIFDVSRNREMKSEVTILTVFPPRSRESATWCWKDLWSLPSGSFPKVQAQTSPYCQQPGFVEYEVYKIWGVPFKKKNTKLPTLN